MAALSVAVPFEVFPDVDGSPLNDGYVYLGQSGTNAETNPVSVYWDSSLTIPAAQPIRTLNGYPSRSGSPGRLYLGVNNYSITVRNKNRSLVYTTLQNTTAISSDLVSFTPSGSGGAETTLSARLNLAPYTIATVAAMKAMNLAAGSLVETKGYYSESDGGRGSGRYFIKTSAEYAGTPDEYGDHTLANGNVAVLQMGEMANVLEFGAKGDGATDDTIPIQKAIDSAITNSKNVEIPFGVYSVGSITVGTDPTNREVIELVGAAKTMDINLGYTYGSILNLQDAVDDSMFTVASTLGRCSFRNLLLRGNKRAQAATSYAIKYSDYYLGGYSTNQSGDVSNCRIEGFRDAGIYLGIGRNDGLIQGCHIAYTGIGDELSGIGTTAADDFASITANTLVFNTNSSNSGFFPLYDNVYNGGNVYVISGTGAGQVVAISAYDAATKTVTLTAPFSTVPDATSLIRMWVYGDGILASTVFDTKVIESNIGISSRHGIALTGCDGIRITDTDVYRNKWNGIRIDSTSQIVVGSGIKFDLNYRENLFITGNNKSGKGTAPRIFNGCNFHGGGDGSTYSSIKATDEKALSITGSSFEIPAYQATFVWMPFYLVDVQGTTDSIVFENNQVPVSPRHLVTSSHDMATIFEGSSVIATTATDPTADFSIDQYVVFNSPTFQGHYILGRVTAVTVSSVTVTVVRKNGTNVVSDYFVESNRCFVREVSNDNSVLVHNPTEYKRTQQKIGLFYSEFTAFTSGDATPSVAGGEKFYTANAGATTITDFDDGYDGQEITVIIGDANTTIDFTASSLKGNGGVDWTPASGAHMRCTLYGTNWYCDIVNA